MKKMKLFIDDIRQPPDETWVVVRSSAEAITWFLNNGCPDVISFDHDLGADDTAMLVVHWMIETDMDAGGAFILADFSFTVHSANPVGRENIKGLLYGYLRHKLIKHK